MEPTKVDIDGNFTDIYEESYALVIGVSNYNNGWSRLPGVKKDIYIIKQTLEANGFIVDLVEDPNDIELSDAFESFIKEHGLLPNNRLLFYFAGHGATQTVEDGREMGYIVPANAPLPEDNPREFHVKSISMRKVDTYAREILSKHALFLFDACFSGALFNISRGKNVSYALTSKITNPVRQFITAGSADEEVSDDSWFRKYFVIALTTTDADGNRDGYLTASELNEFLFENVSNYSYGSQHPQYGKIRDEKLDKGDFVFVLDTMPSTNPIMPPPITIESKEILFGSLALTTEDVSGALYIDGEYRQHIPTHFKYTYEDLSVGTHSIEIRGEETIQRTVSISPDQTTSLSFTKPTIDLKEKKREEITSSFPIMVSVEGGTFQMGSSKGDAVEQPVHPVKINSFYISKHEITQKQWRTIMNSNPKELHFGGCEECPVENVSWYDIQTFLTKLRATLKKNFRLPTEAEWEFAAHGGIKSQGYTYSGSNDLGEVAWYSDNSDYKIHLVGEKKPNELGIYDMNGNVAEWCYDWYDQNYYQQGQSDNPRGPIRGDLKTLRGGSWRDLGHQSRTTYRKGCRPKERKHCIGFRVCYSE